MLWLKRNLALVVALVIGVVLTGLGGYYVWNQMALNDELNTKLGQTKGELTRLTTQVTPSPNEENVRAAREDVRKAQEFSAQCRKFFVATHYQPLSSQGYRSMLETNLAHLRRLAVLSQVEIPTNYAFSFEQQTKPMSFEPASLKPLSEQLTEISEMCQALFNAKIHELEQIRRVAVSQYDGGSSDILGVTVVSNRATGLTIWPYEVTFDCFATELAASLEELSRIPRMLLIKTITVEGFAQGATVGAAPAANTPMLVAPPPALGGGRGGRRLLPGAAVAPRPGVVAPAPKPAALSTVLEERLLRVVILVHVIKPVR